MPCLILADTHQHTWSVRSNAITHTWHSISRKYLWIVCSSDWFTTIFVSSTGILFNIKCRWLILFIILVWKVKIISVTTQARIAVNSVLHSSSVSIAPQSCAMCHACCPLGIKLFQGNLVWKKCFNMIMWEQPLTDEKLYSCRCLNLNYAPVITGGLQIV